MSKYSQKPGEGGNEGRHARFQGDEDFIFPNSRDRRENAGLGLQERLPLPPRPQPSTNSSSPSPPVTRNKGISPITRPYETRGQDSRLFNQDDYEHTGRSLTNPSSARSKAGPQSGFQPKTQYQSSDRSSSQQQGQDAGVASGGHNLPSRSQPRYNKPVEYEQDIDSKSLMMSPTIRGHASMVNSLRSVEIGSNDSSAAEILNTQQPFEPLPQYQNTAPPSSRRGVSSYYSQPAFQVSPIPEESPNPRHGSYASSHVIPSTWDTVDYPEEEEEEESYRPMRIEYDDEKGLVRQASLGKQSRPTITEIRSSSRQESKNQTLLMNTSPDSPVTRHSPLRTNSNSPLPKTSSTASTPTLPRVPSALMAFSFPAPGNFDALKKEAEASSDLSVDSPAHSRNSSMYFPTVEPLNIRSGSMAARMKGRKAPPPGLNLNAVKDAEARGSLTSLPGLIRRATKLATNLDMGKSRDGSWRGTFTASSNRRTDSISDILASFPPPVPGDGSSYWTSRQGSQALTTWPNPSDFVNGNGEDSTIKFAPQKGKGRKVCGLPLWAFILLVILALLVIAAAVIVPLQLVTLSRSRENSTSTNSNAELLRQCKLKNPCANGGENVASKDFCGCVCTGGFGGKTCTELDSSCDTMNLDEIKKFGVTFDGIQNATMGRAIKRLLELSEDKYNVQLDGSKMLSTFWASDISCTAQNALITFNGKTTPDAQSESTTSSTTTLLRASRRRNIDPPIDGPLVYDTSVIATKTATNANQPIIPPPTQTPSSPTPTNVANGGVAVTPTPIPILGGNRSPALDEDAVDFARVVVLFLVQDKGLTVAITAQENLQSGFTAGVDYGSLDAGNEISVDLDNRVLNLPGGISVGGPKT